MILLVSAIIAAVSFFVVMIAMSPTIVTWGYYAVYAVLLLIMPYSLYKYTLQSKMSGMEEQFPILLKDLADNLRAGLTLPQSIKTCANGEYKALTPEIRRMSNEMSWGVTFEDAMTELRDRFKDSPFVSRGLAILLQAYRSGGDISPIMTSVAESTVLLQNVEKDRNTTLNEQVAIIYVIHLTFIIILIMLFKVLIPLTTTGSFGAAIAGTTGMSTGGGGLDIDYYRILFFATILIESACDGMVAGVAKSGSLVAGVRHFAIMFVLGLVLYIGFVLPKTITITAVSGRYNAVPGQEFSIVGKASIDDANLVNQVIKIVVANTTYTGATDSNGGYEIAIRAPQTRGTIKGVVTVTDEGQTAEATFSFKVN